MICIILEYSDFFDDEPEDIVTYLNGIDKWVLIRNAVYYCSFSSKLKSDSNIFYPFFGSVYNSELDKKLNQCQIKEKNVNYGILNTKTSLKFFELIQKANSNPIIKYSDYEINEKLFKHIYY